MAKRLETAQTASKAVSLVKDVLNELNWVCNPLIEDFGIDFHVKVFESDGERRALPWELYIQVKGTTRLRRDAKFALFTIDTPHLRDWSESRLPVLFVVCDTVANEGFWVLVNEYLEPLEDDWEEHPTMTLRIPQDQRVTREGLLLVLAKIRRASFIHEAPGVMAFMERPRPPDDSAWGPHFWITADNPYRQALPPPDECLRNLALSRCVACQNYFWIDESLAEGHDRFSAGDDVPEHPHFTQIYGPRAHEPVVYSCDSPEEFCVFCTTGNGALLQCRRCGRYNIPRIQDLDDWDDPAVTREEAEEHCAECLECLRAQRSEQKTKACDLRRESPTPQC
jgi:hypothetical protein